MPPEDSSSHQQDPTRSHEIVEAIGQSDAFLSFQESLSKVAQVNRPVLLIGERGTGKELAAQRLHFLSRRWEGPFVALNCAALSQTLMESELFGHEAGAYTGAGGRRSGRFEAAELGTLFLDEVGNLPLEVQSKILRVVEYRSFERVGSSKSIEVDVRIVGATNADLHARAGDGRFMRDLLDRLSFEVLVLPPLRERKDDIEILANHFAARMAHEMNWEDMPEITEDAMETLEKYPWPGNVRELKNVIERAVYRSDDAIVARDELIFDPFSQYSGSVRDEKTEVPQPNSEMPATAPVAVVPASTEPDISTPLLDQVQSLEVGLIQCALEKSKFNQRKAAEMLGLTYHQFRGLYRKYQDDLAS